LPCLLPVLLLLALQQTRARQDELSDAAAPLLSCTRAQGAGSARTRIIPRILAYGNTHHEKSDTHVRRNL